MQLFKQYGLTTKQYNILRILNGAAKPVSVAFIRERLLDRVSDVSRIIDRMESSELVIKEPSVTDKRLVDIELSKKGKEQLALVTGKLEKTNGLIKKLSPAEVKKLNELLDKIHS